jgi:hypothetical protein
MSVAIRDTLIVNRTKHVQSAGFGGGKLPYLGGITGSGSNAK